MDAEKEKGASLLEAISAFNQGRFHDAVDAFEVPYHEGPRERRELYLGLVRASAFLYHFSRGSAVSARKLHATARELLLRFAPVADGIRLDLLVSDLDATAAPLLAAGPLQAASLRPERLPRIVVVDDDGGRRR